MGNSRYEQGERYGAPGASGGAARMDAPGSAGSSEPAGRSAPGARSAQPGISEHVVQPETWQEMHDGVVVEVSPALPPHSQAHTDLGFVLRASVAPGYVVDTDLLTRTSEKWNFASDSSVRKKGLDPETGARYLEELAFEVQYTQRAGEVRAKAREMANRGVRRVFLIVAAGDAQGSQVSAGPVKEWMPQEERWRVLGADEVIEDSCLARPIPVRALLDATAADDAAASALAGKKNRVIEQLVQGGYRSGNDEGQREALRTMLHAILAKRGIALDQASRARIDDCRDTDMLQEWGTRALDVTTAAALFTGDHD